MEEDGEGDEEAEEETRDEEEAEEGEGTRDGMVLDIVNLLQQQSSRVWAVMNIIYDVLGCMNAVLKYIHFSWRNLHLFNSVYFG